MKLVSMKLVSTKLDDPARRLAAETVRSEQQGTSEKTRPTQTD
jgi:hypothetical protein